MTEKQMAFIDKLFERHANSLVQFAYRRTGDEEFAKELVQETFLTACCKPEKICNHEKPVAWLYDTLNKLTMREKGRAFRSAEIPLPDYDLIGDNDLRLPMEFHLPAGLKEKERELILLRADRGMSFAEIAELRGISEDACRQQISRVTRKCRALLEKDFIT